MMRHDGDRRYELRTDDDMRGRGGTAATGTATADAADAAAVAAPRPPAATPRDWAALAVLMLPVLLVSIDNTVLGFAVPFISADLRPTGAQQLWIIDIYALVLAALLVPAGAFADRFGRRRMLLVGAAGFTAASVLGAFAPTAGMLIGARALMGLFGALLMPSTLSLLRSIFARPAQRRLAVAIWAVTFGVGGALGPIVGGLLLEHFHWGSVFLMAVPMLIPLLIGGPLLVPESRNPNGGRFDLASVPMILVGMGSLTYAVKAVASGKDLPVILVAAALGVAGLIAFVRRQKVAENPLLDLTLFRNPRFTGAVTVNVVSVFALLGFIFFITQELMLGHGLSPFQAGLTLLPGAAVAVLAGLLVVPLVSRVPMRMVIAAGMLFGILGYVISAIGTGALTSVIVAFVLVSLGIGMAETVSNDLVVSSAPSDRAGAASAVSETGYETGAVLGTAVLGGALTAIYRLGVEVPAGLPADDAAAAAGTFGGAASVAEGLGGAEGAQLMASAHEAFSSGITVTAGIGAALMAAGLVVAWKLIGNGRAEN
ncbi:MFS transporter [Corynebacterium sp. 335C]